MKKLSKGGKTPFSEFVLSLADEMDEGRNGLFIEIEMNGKAAKMLLMLVEYDGKRVSPYDDAPYP